MNIPIRWRRSSQSINGSECVEVAHTLDAVRDSKNPSVTLHVPAVGEFLGSVKGGRWRRSSRSVSGSECVELAHTLDAVRDSKNPTIALAVPARGLIALAKSGR